MADAARLLCQVGGLLGISRTDHRPSIDEDLGANLLGYGLAVQFDRTAQRRGYAGLQAQIGGMFGGVSDPAPPQDRAVLHDVIEPGVADLLGSQMPWKAVIGQRPRERKGAGNDVVGHDEMMRT